MDDFWARQRSAPNFEENEWGPVADKLLKARRTLETYHAALWLWGGSALALCIMLAIRPLFLRVSPQGHAGSTRTSRVAEA